jgi:uncharacterized protein (DUF1697 family)
VRVTTYVALLRGVNVAGARRVKMTDLRDALAGAGMGDVTTYIQSGNVLLGSRARSAAAVERAVEETLEDAFGLGIDVIARSASQLGAIVRRNPFAGRGRDPVTVHVGFLKTRPSAAAATALRERTFGADEFVLDGSELFLHYPNGSGRSKMTGAVFERLLGTPYTGRNWKVTTELARLAADHRG